MSGVAGRNRSGPGSQGPDSDRSLATPSGRPVWRGISPAGVEIHPLEGIPVHVYGVAKTIADLFKYRNKIGLDVAIEALKEVWSDGRVQMDELMDFARICRVERVIRPYLEAVAS